jgi:signal transduction histidine kinase
MNWITLSVLSSLASLFAFNLQSPFRRGHRSESNLATEWVKAARLPALAVLPATGAIIEVNSGARLLLPDRPLLELDLLSLFPGDSERVQRALQRALKEGVADVDVSHEGVSVTMVLTATQPDASLLVAMMLPLRRAIPEPPPEPQPAIMLPPISLPKDWAAQPVEQQLQSLLNEVQRRWEMSSAAILHRQGMELRHLICTSRDPFWKSLHVPAVELGALLHDGAPVTLSIDNDFLMLHPVYLPPDSQPWGALALTCDAGADATTLYHAGLAQVSTIVGLLLVQARSRHSQDIHARQVAQYHAVRDHLLARARRGVLLVDQDGRIELINLAASDLLEWPHEDVTGRPLAPLLTDLGNLGTKIRAALEDPQPYERQSASGRLQRPGKRGREVTFTIERVRDLPGYVLIFLEDREGVVAFTETQHHLDRLAVLGKMSATIAHDLRNPLSALLYGIETLAETLGEESEEAESIRLLLEAGDRVHRIIEDILSISRQPSLTISLCSLRSLMDQIHDTHQRALDEKRIHVRRYYDPSLPLIEGDPVRLGQMLGNLISNAIEVLPQGGQIEVVLRPLALDQMIARGINPDQEERLQGGVEILIRDNGPGIPDSQREQVFEPLFTTKVGGTGLGLAIVRTIVEQHRGMIFLDSELGKGTTFRIFLPQLAISAYSVSSHAT